MVTMIADEEDEEVVGDYKTALAEYRPEIKELEAQKMSWRWRPMWRRSPPRMRSSRLQPTENRAILRCSMRRFGRSLPEPRWPLVLVFTSPE
jgi:hypothetical protein